MGRLTMERYIHKGIFKNLVFMFIGVVLFLASFHVGEGTILGTIMHLSGCSIFCGSTHGIHDLYKHK